jgi:patatin-related protein
MSEPRRDQLRIALGIRGGVSLSVWIGGACREIDALRPSSQASGDTFWARLLEISDVNDVIVDVMAGASAGGLNGIIYAASQIYGFPLEQLRGAWLDLGGLGDLVRTGDVADGGRYPSILQGDEYFLTKTDATLRKLISGGTPPAERPQVDLTLTATLVEPVCLPAGTHRGAVDVRRFGSTFRFRHRGSGWLSDFPPPGSEEIDKASARLALAARATSSYPIAFEAAAIHAKRRPSFTAEVTGSGGGATVDMAGIFGEATSGEQPFVVMDGGVLDNIPLGRALSAITGATADRPTRRVLVYVRPGAASVPTGVRRAADPRSTWSVVNGVVRARVQPETIAADLALVDEHNRRVQRTQRLRMLAFTAAEDPAALRRLSAAATGAYLVQRADTEAQAVLRLLEDPIDILGEDPFPASERVDDMAWRAPLALWDTADAVRLDGALAETLCRQMKDSPLDFGIGPVGRLSQLLLEWARFVERSSDPAGRKKAGRRKQELYRVLSVYRELMVRPRRLAWVVLAATRGGAAGDWEADGLAMVERLLDMSAADAGCVDTYLTGGVEALLQPVRSGIHARLDAIMLGERPPSPGTCNLRAQMLDALVAAAQGLADISIPAEVLPGGTPPTDPAAFLHRAVVSRRGSRTQIDRLQLEALEIVAFPESLVGAPADRPINFVEMSSTSPMPISAAFPRLIGVAPINEPWAAIGRRLSKPAKPIASDNKLAGNELSNFSAFLRRHWRTNDWMWGRLDAVPTLVELLVTPSALVAAAKDAGGASRDDAVASLVATLRAAVLDADPLTGNGDAETSWPCFLDETAWAPRQKNITALAAWAVGAAAAPADESPPPAGCLQVLHDALVSARQWKVLAEELALQRRDVAKVRSPAPALVALGPKETVEAANRYGVGVETMTSPPEPSDSNLIRKLVVAGRRMLAENLGGRVPKAALIALQSVGAILSWSWLGDRVGFRLSRLLLTAATLAGLVVLPVAGSTANGPWRLLAVLGPPGAAGLVAAVVFLLSKRHIWAVEALATGVILVAIAAFPGGNWLASSAVVLVAVLVATLGLWALAWTRPHLGRPQAAQEPPLTSAVAPKPRATVRNSLAPRR